MGRLDKQKKLEFVGFGADVQPEAAFTVTNEPDLCDQMKFDSNVIPK